MRRSVATERETRYTPRSMWAENAARGSAWIVERADKGKDKATIQGYSSVFNVRYSIRDFFGEYEERVDSSAFDKTLRDGGDVIGLFNHNRDYPLGSIDSGTMRQGVDNIGLWYEIDAALNSPQVKSVVVAVEEGIVSGSSMTFQIVRDSWKDEFDDDGNLVSEERTILEARLFEHGPVTTPASPSTTAEINSTATEDDIRSVAIKIRRGLPLTQFDVRTYNAAPDHIRQIVGGSEPRTVKHSQEPLPSSHPGPSTQDDLRRFETHFMGRFIEQQQEITR